MGDEAVVHCPECGVEYQQWADTCVDCSVTLERGPAPTHAAIESPTPSPSAAPSAIGMGSLDLHLLDTDAQTAMTFYLRGVDVPHQWSGGVLSYPASQRDVIDDALEWIGAAPVIVDAAAPVPPTPVGVLPARRWQRLVAAMIDSVIFSITSGLVITLGGPWVLSGVISGVYTVGTTTVWGKTIGKAIVRCQVRAIDSSAPPPLAVSATRWFVIHGALWIASLVASGLPHAARLVVGALLTMAGFAVVAPILWRRDRRGLHDQLASTFVVDRRQVS